MSAIMGQDKIKPLSTKYAKVVHVELQTFLKPRTEKDGTAALTDVDAATFLCGLCVMILRDVYGYQEVQVRIEEDHSMSDVYDFLLAQAKANGTTDILMRPLLMLLKGMESVQTKTDSLMTQAIDELKLT